MFNEPHQQPLDTVPQRCYRSGNLLAVPHYSQQNIYVLPGGSSVTSADLLRHGWHATLFPLWPRSWK